MRLLVFALGLVLLPGIAVADRVFLDNGKIFEDVVVVGETDDEVKFRVASGVMRLPARWVVRIDRIAGPLEDYLARRQALDSRTDVAGTEWLELARWARAKGVGHGFREALLRAGERDPELDELAPLMASISFHFHPDSGVWAEGKPAAPQSIASTRLAVSRPPVSPSADADAKVAEELARAIESLAEAELERTRERVRAEEAAATVRTVVHAPVYGLGAVGVLPFGYAQTGWVFSGGPLKSANADPNDPVVRRPANANARALLSRPPGSLLPVSAYRD